MSESEHIQLQRDADADRLDEIRTRLMDDPDLLIDLMPESDVRELCATLLRGLWNLAWPTAADIARSTADGILEYYVDREWTR